MDSKDRISVIASKHHGVLKTADVVEAGISKKALADYVKERGFERAAHGIYCDPDAWIDDMLVLQLRCPKTVFSHDTALFLHDLTDREPLSYTVTAKTGYNPSHLTEAGVKVYTVKKDLFEIGMTDSITPFGNRINVYNMERTICDVIRSRSTMEAQVLQDALKQYAKRKDKNLHQLMEYADLFHVDRILRQYMEVLL
ncbi:MAG: type IV toxin-antitoxin system AbiEi family antitoxin domain-containing protein [Oscillospiraceae bacterium]|nr:type IV toxin-antitoxin system AbiEi family antitoxin domain-containing protein [Oscillospiraceae bacterium]